MESQQQSETPAQEKEEVFLNLEVAMRAKFFKQIFGGIAALEIPEAVLSLSKEGLYAQMLALDNTSVVEVKLPPQACEKLEYDEEARYGKNLAFGIKLEQLDPIMKRMKKDDSVVVLRINEDSLIVLTFEGKTYRIPMISIKYKDPRPFTFAPTAKIMVSFKEWKELLDDVLLDGKSSHDTVVMTVQVIEGNKLLVKRVKDNPSVEVFRTIKGGELEKQWAVSGSGKGEFNIERVRVVAKELVADNVLVEFGTGPVTKKDRATGEEKQVVLDLPMMITFDEGYIKYVVTPIEQKSQ